MGLCCRMWFLSVLDYDFATVRFFKYVCKFGTILFEESGFLVVYI